uniref:Protein kinase domain-containing protein n=1 Tax=Acrobeloides nanus TaxID=290746 RepID=A0A914E9B9_9BILA
MDDVSKNDDVSKKDDNVKKNDKVHVGTITFNENKENLLHSGSYGTQIYKGSILSKTECVVKIIDAKNYKDKPPEKRELHALTTLRHSNVIKCYGYEKKDDLYYIVLDLCIGSLEDFIQGKIKDRISPEIWDKFQKWNRLEILKQLTNGLAHIHEQNIVHRNLRPKNVLIQTEHNENLVAVISDFVFSKPLDLGSNYSIQSDQNNDQLAWLAPEVERDSEYTTASDIFSLGCLYYYTLTNGKFLFCTGKVDPMRIHQNIIADRKKPEDEQAKELFACKNDRYSSMDLISNMVRANPDERRTAQSLKQRRAHPMFWEANHKMRFVKAVRVVQGEEEESRSLTPIENALESVASNVFVDWIKEIEKIPKIENDSANRTGIDLAHHIRTNPYGGRNYVKYSTKLTFLIRMIRNYKEHKNSFNLGDGITIFTDQFPKLIIEVYKAMATFKTNEELEDFYLKD